MGEVAEQSEAGEGVAKALSVTFADSSPKGGAKGRPMRVSTDNCSLPTVNRKKAFAAAKAFSLSFC